MQKYMITDEQIELVKELLTNRNSLQIRKTLNELEAYQEPKVSEDKSLRAELGRLIRNSGRSVITPDELRVVLKNA